MLARVVFVYLRVQHEERIGVPKRAQELALALADVLRAETRRQPRHRRTVKIPPDRVRALLVEHRPRIDDVALVLGHLDAVLVVDVTQNYAILERRPVKQQRRHREQRVEPASRLVDRLADEVRREMLVEDILVLERIVPLRERHAAAVEPAVHDLGRAVHLAAALGALEHDRIDVRLVKLDVALYAAQLFEFLLAADNVHVPAVLANPNRDGRAPIALARYAPVDDVLKEVAHAPRADRRRDPIDGRVVCKQPVAHLGHLDEPAAARIVQERRVAAPAERIAVLEHQLLEQQAAVFEMTYDQFVAVLDKDAFEVARALDEPAAVVDHLHERQIVLAPDLGVVFTERRRDVNDARTVRQRDVLVADDVERRLVALVEIEKRNVRGVFVIFAPLDVDQCIVVEQRVDKRSRQDVDLAVCLDLGVILDRIHAQRDVGRKRPRRRRPCEEVALLVTQLELDENGLLLDEFVTLRDLVRRKRSAAARAIGHDLVSLVEQSGVRDLLDRPPLRLDVVVLIGDVRMLHVRPIAYALGHALPLVLVLPDALLALADERLDAVLLDVLLAVHAEQFLDLQLDRQTVCVPPRLAQNVIALHRLVTRYDVLHNTRQYVTDVRLAVGGRRTVVEGELGLALGRLYALFEDAVALPKLEHLLLSRAKIHA